MTPRKDGHNRVLEGEVLTKDSPLIKAFGMKKNGGEFVQTQNISYEIRNAIRTAGYSFRPYDLRSFFDTQLLIAENRGKIAHDFRVFWMGHAGTIEATYTTNRHTLSNAILKEMKRAYTESSPFLIQSADAEEMLEQSNKIEDLNSQLENLKSALEAAKQVNNFESWSSEDLATLRDMIQQRREASIEKPREFVEGFP
jgi:hypothetical protein